MIESAVFNFQIFFLKILLFFCRGGGGGEGCWKAHEDSLGMDSSGRKEEDGKRILLIALFAQKGDGEINENLQNTLF